MICQKCSSTCINVTNDNISNDIQDYSLLSLIDISSSITNIPHLTNSDVELVCLMIKTLIITQPMIFIVIKI